ncbi:hypothetical protein N0V90_002054 [Kalmusia sp. IMI 367209]|nr:hypothetical protein N0V90_002054 [Kalmusia sp. IMI 367209]
MDTTNTTANPAVLQKLTEEVPKAVLTPDSPQYEQELPKFWNKDNASIRPSAILTPSTPQETGNILRILSETGTDFAIRSGGYMPVPGYNTSSSILISTVNLNKIEVLPGDLVQFGAGLQWGSVYDFLEPRGLVVPGGRSRPVGVSGFLLHGGVSHFYGEVGWACESVTEFEVVLADGRVVTANEKESADLYWALKGGGKNFGVVTAFTMKTCALPKMWGGPRLALGNEGTVGRVFKTMHEGLEEGRDEKAHVEVISFYNPHACPSGDPLFALCLAYAGETERPEALRGFWEIDSVADMTRVTTQRGLADDEKEFVGYDKRGLFRAFSYRGGPELTAELYKEFYALVKESDVFKDDPTTIAAMLWLPATRKLAEGNSAISIGEQAQPYLSVNIVLRWDKPEVSQDMHSFADQVIQRLSKKVKDAGAHLQFTYANIAGVGDMTFAGLPEKTKKRLSEVAEKYDPQGVFQKQVPGFKLE